jgi:hypothetical protein
MGIMKFGYNGNKMEQYKISTIAQQPVNGDQALCSKNLLTRYNKQSFIMDNGIFSNSH